MKIRRLTVNFLFISVITLTIAIFPATEVWAGNKVFDLVTLGNDGSLPQDSLYSGDRSKITPDGRYVVYRSSETKLVKPLITSGNQIFLRDRQNGTTELISINEQEQFGNAASDWATISNDGCRVIYQSYASNLVPGDTNGLPDIFLRDRCVSPMTTTRVNLNYNGAESQAASYTPAISGDGKFVAFNSYSTDLVPGVTRSDLLYLRDLDQQTTTLLSESIVDGLGEQAWNPSLSYDGSRIAFTAASKELVNNVVAMWNVFLYDANTVPHIRLVSSDANGNPQDNFTNGDQPLPGISDDGHYVSFYSNAHNLVPNDTNNEYDVFVKNVDTNEIWRASESSSYIQSNGNTKFNSTLSKDGTWVTFYTEATNLASDTLSLGRVVLLHNIHTGETRAIPEAINTDPDQIPKISGDLYGRFISSYWKPKLDASLPHAGVFVYDRHRLPVAVANIDATTTQPVQQGDTVMLDGSSSNNNANVNSNTNFFAPNTVPNLLYTWTQTEGNSITFNDPHAAKPTFIVPAEGTYTFKLVVNDTVEDSAPATVTIQVGAGPVTSNQKPIANAGPDQTGKNIGDNIVLDGSQSLDPDNGPSQLSYSWTQISGQAVNLTDSTTATPSFTPTSFSVSYSFRLVVNDGKDSSTPDVVTITLGNIESNVPPVAIAGDNQTVTLGDLVTLDGSQSFDPDASPLPLTYQWSQIGGPLVTLNYANSDAPNFTPTKIGSYSFKLLVNDSQASSLGSVVTVTVESASTSTNVIPVAVAGIASTKKIVGTAIKLRGTDSYDPDRKPKRVLKYQWVQSDGPALVKLLAANTSAPKFTTKQPGDYVFDLAVFDGADWSTTESVSVHIDAAIQILTPAADDIWALGVKQTISYQTSGINPTTPLTAYLYLVNTSTGNIDGYKLKIKPKAKASGSFTLKLPLNASELLTPGAVIVLCVNDNFCGNSGIFGIQ